MSQHTELINKVAIILEGIDKAESDDDMGWWETSAGAEFGARKRAEVIAALQSLERVPMTNAERTKLWIRYDVAETFVTQWAFEKFVRIVEAHHKITQPESKG